MTNIRKIVAAVTLTAGLIATPTLLAQAQSQSPARELIRAGAWAAHQAVSNRGVPMCVMGTEGNPYSLFVKYFRGDQHLAIHVFGEGWNLQPDARIPVQLRIGQENWSGNATVLGSRGGLEVTLGQEEVERFEAALRSGGTATVSFPNTNVRPLEFQLAGIGGVLRAFSDCVGQVNGRSQASAPAKPGSGAPQVQHPQMPAQAPRQPVALPEQHT